MSMSKMIIPNGISVGFQERSDTYTKKLAYVIYTDAKGKLRKEKSWNSWKDKNIPVEEYDNEPTSGFVLNKKVGDYKSDWNHRSAAVRIYDPRGFEFEISVENLLYILQECSSVKGKGLEGDFVYAWDGTELVLLPTTSQEYKDSANFTSLQTKKITKNDIKEGFIYINKDNEQVMYLGRFDWTTCDHKYEYGKTSYGSRDYSNYSTVYRVKTQKKHVFVHIDEKKRCYTNSGYWIQDGFTKLAAIESTEVSSLFADAYDKLKKECKHIGSEFEIKKRLREVKIGSRQRDYFYSLYFRRDGKNFAIESRYVGNDYTKREYFIREYDKETEYDINETDLVCAVKYNRNYNYYHNEKSTPITFKEIEKLIEEKIEYINKSNNCVLEEI